ncbi:MAG: DUF503 domain-containing protein [Actinomycetota bacterium]|nr:DUF503 domain-containing protein [Actinomycetota bacterium]
MHVVALRVELRIRGARSLKEKRHTVKAVISQLTATFRVAVAEVDDLDKWQRATLGVAVVSGEAGHLTRVVHSVERWFHQRQDVEVLAIAATPVEMVR